MTEQPIDIDAVIAARVASAIARAVEAQDAKIRRLQDRIDTLTDKIEVLEDERRSRARKRMVPDRESCFR